MSQTTGLLALPLVGSGNRGFVSRVKSVVK